MGDNKLCGADLCGYHLVRTEISSFVETILCFLVVAVIAGVAAIGLLVAFQYDLCKLRKRIEITSNYCYAGQEKRAFDIKKDEYLFGRGWHILAALIAVCGFGAVLVLFVLD